MIKLPRTRGPLPGAVQRLAECCRSDPRLEVNGRRCRCVIPTDMSDSALARHWPSSNLLTEGLGHRAMDRWPLTAMRGSDGWLPIVASPATEDVERIPRPSPHSSFLIPRQPCRLAPICLVSCRSCRWFRSGLWAIGGCSPPWSSACCFRPRSWPASSSIQMRSATSGSNTASNRRSRTSWMSRS